MCQFGVSVPLNGIGNLLMQVNYICLFRFLMQVTHSFDMHLVVKCIRPNNIDIQLQEYPIPAATPLSVIKKPDGSTCF